jgi:hypothetical protein
VPPPDLLLRDLHGGLDQLAPQPRRGGGQAWLGEQGVGARHLPARIGGHRRRG